MMNKKLNKELTKNNETLKNIKIVTVAAET